jgi:hypothetical protein
MWKLVHDDLPALDKAFREEELDAAKAREKDSPGRSTLRFS